MAQYDYFTMEAKGADSHGEDHIAVYGWGTYERSSVLAGQCKKQLIDWVSSQAEGEEKYPGIRWGNKFSDAQNSFDHLPDGPDW